MGAPFKKDDILRCIDTGEKAFLIKDGVYRCRRCYKGNNFTDGEWYVNVDIIGYSDVSIYSTRFELVKPAEFSYFNPNIDYLQITKDVCQNV